MPTLWPYPARGTITERLGWLTDVMEASSGVEQRHAIRVFPRRSFEFDVLLAGRDARAAEHALHGNAAGEWYVPVWMDAERLSAQANSGSTTLPADTALRDYHADGYVALIDPLRPHVGEVCQIVSLTGSALTLADPLAATWAQYSTLVPLRLARVQGAPRLARFTGDSWYGRLRFACVDDTTWSAASETTYRSLPVMEHRTNWDADPTRELGSKVATVDSGIGAPAVFPFAGTPAATQGHRWLCDGRTEADTLRQWLFARRGRLSAFWLPSWVRDLEPLATIDAADTTIDVQHCGYTAHIAQDIGRRDVRIRTRAGTTYYRRITTAAVIDADTERLTLSSALGVTLTLADVEAISFMHLARLDADEIDIAWHRWDVAEAAFVTRGIRNDL